jgi:hypothetical protein
VGAVGVRDEEEYFYLRSKNGALTIKEGAREFLPGDLSISIDVQKLKNMIHFLSAYLYGQF